MKLNLPPKLMKKLVWVPVILFCKKFHSQLVTCLMPYYVETVETGCSRPLIESSDFTNNSITLKFL
jgi:hypothetical protein